MWTIIKTIFKINVQFKKNVILSNFRFFYCCLKFGEIHFLAWLILLKYYEYIFHLSFRINLTNKGKVTERSK